MFKSTAMNTSRDRSGARDVTLAPADERAAADQADAFASVRNAHESEMAEDYVELIAELVDRNDEARPVDLAERLGVKPPTVTKNISRLVRAGLVRRERYRSIFLTEKGAALADACRRRHRTVVATLVALGVDPESAERDAEGIEHHVSDETLEAFERFVTSCNCPLSGMKRSNEM